MFPALNFSANLLDREFDILNGNVARAQTPLITDQLFGRLALSRQLHRTDRTGRSLERMCDGGPDLIVCVAVQTPAPHFSLVREKREDFAGQTDIACNI